MIAKEVAELRRRYRSDKSNISHVCGCFVNEKKEIISEFDQSLGMLNEEDTDQMLSVLKKTLSGSVGRNLLDIEFSTQQVTDGEECQLLRRLRDTELKDKEAISALYEKIISSLIIEGNFLILLAHDRYDVFNYGADGKKEEDSSQVFSYILCSICPVKSGKPVLSYYLPGNCFRSICADTLLAPPEIGFLYPAFDDRTANIYKALYYTRNISNSHTELVDALFSSELPMPAAEQKETFGSILAETMEEDCSLRVVRSVYSQLCRMIEEHKAEKSDEPLTITGGEAGDMLRYCGMTEEKIESFEEKFKEEFGENTAVPPENLADGKQLHLRTPDIEIKVSAGNGDQLEARTIDGVKYILIRADGGDVEVNGIPIRI